MIVRWGIDSLAEVTPRRPFLLATDRWSRLELPIEPMGVWRELPSPEVEVPTGAEGIVALGGGSTIDTGKAASAASGLPLVSVPTTYAGAEWTPYFGLRGRDRKMVGGGSGARLHAVVYEPRLTLDLPRAETGGTAMNALAHCAEALYARGHNPDADEHALAGARLIAEWLPRVLDVPADLDSRTHLLEGAMHAGAALGGSMLALGHALAQAVGGRYGLPHGTLNGICLPAALRFNAALAPDAVRRFGEAIGAVADPAARVEELTALGGPTRLRELGVPEDDLASLAEAASTRAGNQANPRPATAAEIEGLLRSVW